MDEWMTRWGYELSIEPVREGIYRLREGGYFLRMTLSHPRTGQRKEFTKVLRDVRLPEAVHVREGLIAEARVKLVSPKPEMPLFYEYAASLFEAKVLREKIRSGAGRSKWEGILRLHLYPVFGAFQMDEVTHDDVESWFLGHAPSIAKEELSPRTANTRLGILRVIFAAAAAKFGFVDPTRAVEPFETTLHPTYTPEEPNSLTPDELPAFLQAMHEHCAAHYGVTFLGFVTGLRPSTLFPLRIVEDVKWDARQIWIRRSHTVGQEVMTTTKTGIGYPIGLPDEAMNVLRWQEKQIEDGSMRESGLLFPSVRGTIRFVESLAKPFAKAAAVAGIKKHITPRAMRRTFQDITRAAEVESVVKRSISGHATQEMEGWYSTVAPDEQRASLAKVIDFLDHKAKLAKVPAIVLLK
jgi:integrase